MLVVKSLIQIKIKVMMTSMPIQTNNRMMMSTLTMTIETLLSMRKK